MRRKNDAALKAKIALEALREQSTVTRTGHALSGSSQICAWKEQLKEQAARAFDSGVGREAEAAREREIERIRRQCVLLSLARSGVYRPPPAQ
jgi:transposase